MSLSFINVYVLLSKFMLFSGKLMYLQEENQGGLGGDVPTYAVGSFWFFFLQKNLVSVNDKWPQEAECRLRKLGKIKGLPQFFRS